MGSVLKRGQNDLLSAMPDLSKEWHPEKNKQYFRSSQIYTQDVMLYIDAYIIKKFIMRHIAVILYVLTYAYP